MEFYDNLSQGNFIPVWIESSCSGYGCPGFLFTFILSHYLISFIHFLGFSFINSAKVVMAFSFIISGIGMFFWIKDELGEKPAFTSAIFFLFAPYHLLDLHFRVSIAELVSMAILPFLFLTTKKLIERKIALYFIATTLLFALLILSHQVTSLASVPFLLIYGLVVWLRGKKRSKSGVIMLFMSYMAGVLLTAYYWMPVIMENKYTLYSIDKAITFHPFADFLYSPNRFGLLFQGNGGEIYTSIGYTQWVVFFMGIYVFFKRKLIHKEKVLLLFSVLSFCVLFVMMQSFTRPIWENLPIIENFQFSWRLTIQAILFIAIMAGIVAKTFNNKIFLITLCFLTIGYTILNWGNRGVLPGVNDEALRQQLIFPEYPGSVDVLTPIWVDKNKPWIGTPPKNKIEILNGEAEIKKLTRIKEKHEYVISVYKRAVFLENTNYFPGWKVIANNNEIPINYKRKDYPGIITFALDKGLHKVELRFDDTPVRILGKWVSGITALMILLYFFSRILKRDLPFGYIKMPAPKRKV
jgi:hypothetical protein